MSGIPGWKLPEDGIPISRCYLLSSSSWELIESLENHDQPRTVSRITSDHPSDRSHCAKLIAMFQCSLQGTLYIYEGQELGLANVPREWGVEEYKDIETIQHMQGELDYRRKMGKEEDKEGLLREMRMTARDNGRTPMQVRLVIPSTPSCVGDRRDLAWRWGIVSRQRFRTVREGADTRSGIRASTPGSPRPSPGCGSTMTMPKDGMSSNSRKMKARR
jgi:hypothetical protein